MICSHWVRAYKADSAPCWDSVVYKFMRIFCVPTMVYIKVIFNKYVKELKEGKVTL